MTAAEFLTNFGEFANAPGGVAKLRQIILSFATNGTLVAQSGDDEPAHVLLERIKNALSAQSQGRTRPQKTEDTPYAIPDGWVWTTIGELAVQITSGSRGWAAHYSSSGAIFVRMGNLSRNSYRMRLGSLQYVKAPKDAEGARTRLEPNDILVSITGEVGLLGLVPENFGEAYINQHTCLVRLPSELQNRYFAEFLRSPLAQSQFNEPQRGLKNSFRLSDVALIRIPLPPLAEQKRIVAKVDELMALCDQLEAQQQERERRFPVLSRTCHARFAEAPTPANLNRIFDEIGAVSPDDLRKTILTLAVQGKLVPQDAREESATKLLEEIAAKREQMLTVGYPNPDEAKSQLRKQREQRLPEDLQELPVGWKWATLMQTSLLIADCHNKTAPYISSGIRLVRTTNIRNGQLNSLEPKYVSEATYERWSARCKPEPGDIIITREAPMGEVCIIPQGVKLCMGQRMMLIRLIPGTVDANFLLYSLMDPALMQRVQDKPIGATVQHLRVGGVETLLVAVPPLAEQRRIVAKVDELMALVDQLEAQQQERDKLAEAFAKACVASFTTA